MPFGVSVIDRRRYHHSTKDLHKDPMIIDEPSIYSVEDLDILENTIEGPPFPF